ncbi:MAG: type II toxin-antitoxin system VapC family toxin [Methanothrix sp.]|nr:type II toxin-antitoxin system VapC family toxin [Methanothrix sp.]
MHNALQPVATVFIDANIFLYKILEHWKYEQPCTKFLKDINYGKYSGVTSIFVCNEVFHIVMFAELIKEYNIDAKLAIKYLKDNPEVIKELGAARDAIENIAQTENLTIVGVEKGALDLALDFSEKYGLLATDSIHAATMKMEGLSILAT